MEEEEEEEEEEGGEEGGGRGIITPSAHAFAELAFPKQITSPVLLGAYIRLSLKNFSSCPGRFSLTSLSQALMSFTNVLQTTSVPN